MDTFSPEFSSYWLDAPTQAGERVNEPAADTQELSPSQQAALEELAERVNAARSVV